MHIQTAKQEDNKVRERVLQLLKWDAEQMADFIIDTGTDYARDVLKFSEWDVQQVMCNKLYWKWWHNQWQMIDAQIFLPSAIWYPDPELMYRNVHSPEFIKGHPSHEIIESSYAEMIGKLHDTEINKEVPA